MWFTKQADGFRVWFAVKTAGGLIRTGIPAGQFTATIVDPGDSTTLVPAVVESVAKPGLYSCFVTSAFLIANGVGEYGVVIQVLATGPTLRDVFSGALMVTVEDLDTLAVPGDAMDLIPGAVDAAAIATDAIDADALAASGLAEIADAVWDEPVAGHLAAGTFGRFLARTIAAETTAVIGSTSTVVLTGLTQADDFFNNMQVVVVNAAGIAVRNVDDFANAGGAITVGALPFTPAAGDVVLILAKTGSVPINTAAIAVAVWSTALPGAFTAGQAGFRLALVEKILRNRLQTDPVAGTITVYDDDSVTPLITAPLFEDIAATQTYRGSGADRRDRLT